MSEPKHVAILDPMRGVAALAVVIFHYLGSILPTLRPNGIEHIVEHGKIGVQVFFVISGFVIPYAMQRAGHTWHHTGRFMLRRFVRIAPPAYIAAACVVAFHLIAQAVNGRPVDGDPFPGLGVKAVISNLFFVAEYTSTGWYNFVYWSLTAEFEFYLAIALLFPLLAAGSSNWRVLLAMLALLLTNYIQGPAFFHYVIYFELGILVFLWRETTTDRWMIMALAAATCAVGIAQGRALPVAISVIAALIIASGTTARSRATDLLGDISYSLYITHVPVAYFAETIIKRVTDLHVQPFGKAALFVLYITLALGIAWLFHVYIERPFQHLSKTLAKRSQPKAAAH